MDTHTHIVFATGMRANAGSAFKATNIRRRTSAHTPRSRTSYTNFTAESRVRNGKSHRKFPSWVRTTHPPPTPRHHLIHPGPIAHLQSGPGPGNVGRMRVRVYIHVRVDVHALTSTECAPCRTSRNRVGYGCAGRQAGRQARHGRTNARTYARPPACPAPVNLYVV